MKYLRVWVKSCTFELRSKVLSFEKKQKKHIFLGFLLTYSYLCSRISENPEHLTTPATSD